MIDRAEAKDLFERLFKDSDGFSVSMANRKKLDLQIKELTYGEIEFDSFCALLDQMNVDENDIFYDLGCGTGKPVIAAALVKQCKKSVGIELLEDVYNLANEIKEKLEKLLKADGYTPPIIEYVHGDIVEKDFSEADVVYIASTCFDQEFMAVLAKKCETLKSGTKIATLTKELISPELIKTQTLTLPMTWGNTTVFIYFRK